MISQPQELTKLDCTLETTIEAAVKAGLVVRMVKLVMVITGPQKESFFTIFLYICMVLSELFVCRCIEVQALFLKI
jgi:hypothetical protein